MEFQVTAERIGLGDLNTRCKVRPECMEYAAFYMSDVPSCKGHLWMVLMHEYRKAIGKGCLIPAKCIPGCTNV